MSDATATVVETPAKTGESRVELGKNSAEAAIESGDASGVYRIAQAQVDEAKTRELGISKIDDVQTATVAGPEIVALKQADAEFSNRVDAVLGNLKSTLDVANKPAPVAPVEKPAVAEVPVAKVEPAPTVEAPAPVVEAKKEVPAVVEPVVEVKPVEEAPKVVSVEKTEDATMTVETLPAEEAKQVVELDAMMQKIDSELAAEKKAIEEFNGTHGAAHTKLEQAYLDALTGRVTALEFEKKAHETGDTSFEALAKAAELKQRAEKAEAAYQEMYNGFMNQPVEPHPEQAPQEKKVEGLHLDEEDEDYEARQYEAYHPGSTFAPTQDRQPKEKPVFEPSPTMETKQAKPKGRFGKFIDGLKFWRAFTGKQQ